MNFKDLQKILFCVVLLAATPVYGLGFGDIVFSELMVDPEPAIGLPTVEYVELFNRSDQDIRLNDCALLFGTKRYSLPETVLPVGSYAVLCAKTSLSRLQVCDTTGKGVFIGLSVFPGLTNSGGMLALVSQSNEELAVLEYFGNWYGSGFKSDGGWSLECRDLRNMSGSAKNWTASVHPSGGTPGFKNSTSAECPDEQLTRFDWLQVLAPDTIELHTTKALKIATVTNFSVEPYLSLVKAVEPSFPDRRSVLIVLSDPLEAKLDYILNVKNMFDVSGLSVADTSIELGLPEPLQASSWRINELLFNPKTGGCDYVELYQNDTRWLSLTPLRLAARDASGNWGRSYAVSSIARPCKPGSIWLLSVSSDSVCKVGSFPFPPNCSNMTGFPSMPDEGGVIGLLTASGEVLDEVAYSPDMHFSMLSSKEGVALERRNPSFPSDYPQTWASASSLSGFGTPGLPNAQWVPVLPSKEGGFSLTKSWMTPNNNGMDDAICIACRLDASCFCNIYVYDLAGKLVRTVVKNAFPGTNSMFFWDGTDGKGNLVPGGRYIMYAEAFMPGGSVVRQKMVVTVLF